MNTPVPTEAEREMPLPCPFCGGRAEYKQGRFTGYMLCLSCEVMGPSINRAEAVATWNIRADLVTPSAGEDAQPYKDALHDLLMCRSEQWAIGGGPGWKDREAKAWRAAEELFEP